MPRLPQSAAVGAAATATSMMGVAGAVVPDATSVQSGGSGGYCVGRHLMSHGCIFVGRVFMWCLVPFFCGRDEHSTTSSDGKPTE